MSHVPPKNLNLFTIRFPLPAIVSILHRISGLVLFLLLPCLLWCLSLSLTETGFQQLTHHLSDCRIKFLVWLLLLPFIYHVIAGIRHLLSDIHVGNTRKAGKVSASIVLITFVLISLLLGMMLW